MFEVAGVPEHASAEKWVLAAAHSVEGTSIVLLPKSHPNRWLIHLHRGSNFLLTNHNHTVMVCRVKRASADPMFRALADPTRRGIFEELTRRGEQTVHALTRYAGVSQPAVSKHLTVLKRAKLVRHRRDGRETHYRAEPEALGPMVDWLHLYGAFWRDRFDKLEVLLERMES